MQYIGEAAALATALCWAVSVILFRRLAGNFTPLNLNFWKGLLSIAGIGLILLLRPQTTHFDSQDTLWLLLSGLIGIGVGDTAFFAALNRMGERATLLLSETMAPILTALLAMLWISEWLNWQQWLAIGIILLGVDIVVRSRKGRRKHIEINLSGFAYAALAALCQAVGAVIGRDILTNGETDSVAASLVRLCGGMLLLVPLIAFSKHRFMPRNLERWETWKNLLHATFWGTFIAMLLQMYAFAHAEAAIVQSLFAASIIFALILAAMRGDELKPSAWIGSGIAVLGVAAIFWS